MRLKVVYTVHERNADGSYGSSTTHVARTASGVSRPADSKSSDNNPEDESNKLATTFLKSCLTLICVTRPDLIPDVNTDYSVSVLDIAESAAGHGRVFEGQGMMGWILAEQNSGVTCIAGKLQKQNDASTGAAEDMLEVVLELKPRKPIPRKDILSTLTSSSSRASTPQPQPASTPTPEVAAAPQSVTLPNGSTIDSNAMLAMLQTLFTAAASTSNHTNASGTAADSPESQARQLVNTLGANMPLLPGINLFNPIQAKAVQQQQQQQQQSASSPASASSQSFPLAKLRASKSKPPALNLHRSNGSTSSNPASASHHPMSESNAGDMGRFSFPPKANNNGRSQTANGHQFANRSINNAASASATAMAGSSAHPASEPMHSHNHQQQKHEPHSKLKYWAPGCLQCGKKESKQWRVKQKRKKALDGTDLEGKLLPEDGSVSKLCEECAQKLPSKQMKKKRKAEGGYEEVSALNPAYRAILPNTSPLRRSPRRHHQSNRSNNFLSAQPLTSPTGLNSNRHASSSITTAQTGPSGKRRKFTTALSAAALRVENKTAEGLTPDEGSFLQSIPQFKPQINGKDAVFNINDNNATLQQAKEVFGGSSNNNLSNGASMNRSNSLNTPTIDGMISHEDAGFDFFLNASPGTIMRSFNIMSPKKNSNSTPTNDPPSAATIKASFPNLGLSPLQSRILASDATGTSAVFSPLGSSLSTPFRALLNSGSSKGRERATSEQPPASHSRLMQELDSRDGTTSQNQQILSVPHPNGIPQFLSSDDNLLGSASNVQINLMPATADRRQGNKTDNGITADNLLLSDSMMNDFNAFLLNSSNGLFSPTPFIPKPDNAGKPALAPLTLPQHDAVKQQSLSPLAMLSSEMDVDLSNLPPSSPPPLPGSSMGHHASSNSLANMQNFWNTFNSGFSNTGNYLASGNKNGMQQNGQQIDDGQSPISVSTTVTQGGTPQDMPISHDTGPSEPGHSTIIEEKVSAQSNAAPYSRVAKGGTSSNVESPLSLIDTDSMHDPLFEYFSFANDTNGSTTHDYVSHHHRQSSASSVSSAFLERLKKSTSAQVGSSSNTGRGSSSSMAMTWSDSTASVSSLASMPVTDLTARSKQLKKQKALEEAKSTKVPIDSAVLENTLDASLDMDY